MVRQFLSRVYLAAPFFTPGQIENLEIIENLCAKFHIDGISPRKFMVLKPRAPLADRKKVFDENVRSIRTADLILAGVDGNDTGTSWEMGMAYGIGKPVVGYTWGSKLNVMQAQSCAGFLTGMDQIKQFLEGRMLGYQEVDTTGRLWDFNWEVARQWKLGIY